MKRGIKHLIECHCVLPQYRSVPDPSFHRFVVFSVIDDHDNVIPKYVRCNNCGVVHRVTDLMKSEVIMGNESDASVILIEDIKHSLPSNVVSVMESYSCDLPTWEQVAFIFETSQWGSQVILTSETIADERRGKLMLINGPVSLKIESYSYKTAV